MVFLCEQQISNPRLRVLLPRGCLECCITRQIFHAVLEGVPKFSKHRGNSRGHMMILNDDDYFVYLVE